MGRAPCCSKVGLHRGPWTPREDALLANYIHCQGEGNWRNLPKNAGLLRCGKSCRLRWVNYLRPDIKRGNIGAEEEDLIIRLHGLLGNRWSLIAGRLPGRTDNEIKNYWNSHLSKRQKRQGVDVREGSSKAASDRNWPTQRKGSGHNNKNPDHKRKKAKVEGTEETTTRIKIHAPKPTRIRPVFRNSNAMEVSEGTDSKNRTTISDEEEEEEEEKGDASVGNLNIDWFKEADPQVAGDDINHVSCDLPSQNNLFEMLYQEYLQLLNSDSDQIQENPFADRWYGYESL